jgi:hypothetical protein
LVGFLGEINLRDHVGRYGHHMLISMDQAGTAPMSRSRDQRVGEGKPLLHCATDIEREEGHYFIDRD